ncbi:MAG: Capsule synthesis protein, CapA [Candidatus Nomurabacteria bacterium GW2011_GWB1_40_7]|uniref:Capsule synthesis protein, CapA n=1 Tax=Candidatus Nomurabacteria bacterium GW2011_GWB1_40_7 TaxID=1618744 RepID=A0A0G0SZU8_9BACT|nr:MAG: Capsule synthesis protein, CapA [Candidatus Nomurabacteria bacterium GW2011_GWB1_40_7]
MKRFLNTKILWGVFSVIIGISLTNVAFSFLEGKILSPGDEASVIQLLAPEEPDKAEQFKYFYINKDTNGGPKISAKAYLVGDINTGEVILSKNQDQKFPIASLSKLMTALVAKEITAPEETTRVSKTALATHGANGNLRLGEKIKISDLLYPLLLESSNDAAEALSLYFGRNSFIAKMNQKAAKLQMDSTSFEDPSGLSPNNQSTVSDLFKLTGYLTQQYPDLFKITTKRSYSNKKHSWSNISQFLGKDGYGGGKSGYTDEAKQTVVSLFNLPLGESGSRPIAVTILQSPDRRKDVESILKYLKKNIYYGGVADASTNWVREKIGIPDIRDQNFATLVFAGDIMLDRGVKNSVVKNFNNDYSQLFEKSDNLLELLRNSDIFFANLEGPVSDRGVDQKNLYSFRMDPVVIPTLKGAGVSIVSLANNHVADWGRSAFIDTLARLKENEILYTGGGNNSVEAETPVVFEKYGMKIGYLAFSDVGPNYMSAGIDKVGVLLASDSDFDNIIKNAAKQVDYLIVAFHFGEEYQTKHNARQEELAHKAIDDGAKIVIGTHPHVIQDTEVYKNGYIAYSLGNFIFDQSWSKPTMQGMLLELKLFKDGSITAKKSTTQLNSVFQLEKITQGDEERVRFQ